MYAGSMWIRPYVLLTEENQIQPLFWHHVALLVNKPDKFRMKLCRSYSVVNKVETLSIIVNTQTKTYVCTLEFILVDVVTLLYKLELSMHWKCCSLYTLATIEEKGWDCSQMYNWHNVVNRIIMSENLSLMRTNVWIAIPLFGVLMPLGGVNGNLYWLFTHQTAEETIECHSCN